MSAALSRLRRIFNLLLITGHGAVEPTERALAIHQEFASLLKRWRRATAPREILDESAPARPCVRGVHLRRCALRPAISLFQSRRRRTSEGTGTGKYTR